MAIPRHTTESVLQKENIPLERTKNGGHFPSKNGHDPFPQLMVPEYAHILTWYSCEGSFFYFV